MPIAMHDNLLTAHLQPTSGHLDSFSIFGNNHFKRYIHFLAYFYLPKGNRRNHSLSSLIIPTCENHYLKFTNYLNEHVPCSKEWQAKTIYQKQNFSSLITYQTKENQIKRSDKSKHTCIYLKFLDATILKLGHYCQQ